MYYYAQHSKSIAQPQQAQPLMNGGVLLNSPLSCHGPLLLPEHAHLQGPDNNEDPS